MSFFHRHKLFSNVLLSAGSIALVLLLLEGGMRVLVAADVMPPPVGGSLGRTVGLYDYDALLGWKNRPGFSKEKRYQFGDEMRTVTESINSQGLRGEEITLEKAEGSFRVVALGCSRTYGYGVNNDQTYSAALQDILKNQEGLDAQVLNLGVNGFGIDQMALNFEKYGRAYQPDLVVLQLYMPNIVRAQYGENFSTPKPVFSLVDGRLALENTPVPKQPFRSVEATLMSNSYLYAFVKGTLLRIEQGERADKDAVVATDPTVQTVSVGILKRLKQAVQDSGARLVVFYWTGEREFFESIGEQAGVEMVNLFDLEPREKWTQAGPLDNPPPVLHWSVNGNRFVATALVNYMKANGIGLQADVAANSQRP